MDLAPVPPMGEAYAVFCGEINHDAVQRFFNSVGAASGNGIDHLHVLFHTLGGFVGDGVCLYNFFSTLPIALTLYNCGSVNSIGAIAYLGAKKRKASAGASFLIHRSGNSSPSATATTLQTMAESLRLDDDRTEAILRKHIRLTDTQWGELDRRDLVFSATEALQIGFATEIAEFSPPAGCRIYNI